MVTKLALIYFVMHLRVDMKLIYPQQNGVFHVYLDNPATMLFTLRVWAYNGEDGEN